MILGSIVSNEPLGQGWLALIGIKIGMLLPLTFWRQMLANHFTMLGVLVAIGVAEVVFDAMTASTTGDCLAQAAAVVFAALFVTPAVLINPVIQRIR
jgi:hypothetical protein